MTALAKAPQKKAAAGATSARERLLDAAAVVFARDGLQGSTTREIARAAGVNEVTLFRLFENKKNLLTAVLQRVFSTTRAEGEVEQGEMELGAIIQKYAERYAANLRKNLGLRRVLIGEIQHFQEHELMVIRGIFEPARQQLIGQLRAAQKAGRARAEMNPAIVADQIHALVFMGVLKHSLPLSHEYGAGAYLDAAIETIVRANEARCAATGKGRKG